MSKHANGLIWILLLVFATVSCGQTKQAGTVGLSEQGQNVVDYLLSDWAHKFRSTTIPTAMSNLGFEANDDLRLELIRHFRNNPDLARNLRYWGPNNYVLTNNEKRIAKYLLNAQRDHDQLPGLTELSDTIGLAESNMRDRLKFLARVELLESSADNELGYVLVADAEMWGGPLRHNFHTVTYAGEKAFDVW